MFTSALDAPRPRPPGTRAGPGRPPGRACRSRCAAWRTRDQRTSSVSTQTISHAPSPVSVRVSEVFQAKPPGPRDVDEVAADGRDLSGAQLADAAVEILRRRNEVHLRGVRDQRLGSPAEMSRNPSASSRRTGPSARTRAGRRCAVGDRPPADGDVDGRERRAAVDAIDFPAQHAGGDVVARALDEACSRGRRSAAADRDPAAGLVGDEHARRPRYGALVDPPVDAAEQGRDEEEHQPAHEPGSRCRPDAEG